MNAPVYTFKNFLAFVLSGICQLGSMFAEGGLAKVIFEDSQGITSRNNRVFHANKAEGSIHHGELRAKTNGGGFLASSFASGVIGLDGFGECGCMASMKLKFLAMSIGAVLLLAGCVSTVNQRTTPGMPFIKDRVEGRYERSVDEVFQAAKQVISSNGVLVNESTLYNQTNTVKTVEGKVNQRSVWVRVEPVDLKITEVIVQTRTPGGGADIDLAHELEKEIALKLK